MIEFNLSQPAWVGSKMTGEGVNGITIDMYKFVLRAGGLFNSMHAIKGGWVGQTFALAKHNESGGKKSRIRRSKEEWKALVESFIKKYQKVNNGNFPSVTLTHKELGGSYYTVREAVRDVIQENRVLGPAKLTSEDPSLDRFLEQSPLGSISIEPEADLSSSNGSHIVTDFVPKSYQDTSKELVLDSSVQCPESEHQSFDEGKNVNGSSQVVEETEVCVEAIYTDSRSMETVELIENVAELEACRVKVTHPHQETTEEQVLDSSVECPESEHRGFDEGKRNINGSTQVVVKTEELDKATYTESLPMEILELNGNVEELETSAKVTAVGIDVIVETFPLRSGSKKTYGLDGKYVEQSDLDRTLVEEEINRVETEEVNNSSVVGYMNLTESASDLGDEKVVANIAGHLLEKNRGLVDEKPVDNLEAPVLENLDDSATKKATVLGTGNGRKAEVEDASLPGTKVVIEALVGVDAQSLNGTITSFSSELSNLEKERPSKSNPNPNPKLKNGSVSPKGSTPTLDRMNLESWETTSKKPAKPDTNPLLVFVKSFISAFMKFWS
ncbi:hypothetical protein RHSIM_Rhsim03G0110800 [Rhododendron simsii]|uniref:AT3G52170-like helix-turn-helix domain-containing protein n=1 Tax=Rhododendron simsii TaxID=118357 RepID=A0A834LV02_RHOSS|nr:hypothetical protein RHSIM_Rhsim03G0110800 [Rhododendron simsii]